MTYNKLFSKCKIGTLTLKNRVVMPAMGTSYAEYNGEAGENIIDYYEARAKGGCGLIITEITRVNEESGVGLTNQLSATNVKYVKNLKKLAQTIQRHNCAIFLQLQHPGRATPSHLLGGRKQVAPSELADPTVGEVPHAMTVEEIQLVIKQFITSACYAQMAGFDGVEIHAAHGYLINQFLSPYSNRRTDEYGGSLENRTRFLTQVLMGIKAVCGAKFPVSVRISADEFVENGLGLEESTKIASQLEALGADAINVSCGVYATGHTCIEPSSFAEGWKRHLGQAIKAVVGIPVIATNNIKHPAMAETMLDEDVCDFVAVGRGQLADSEWCNKAKNGQDGSIRKCIGCLHCFNILNKGMPLLCTVNPLLGREYLYHDDTLKKDGNNRRVVVAGGGPGGMQAAKILALRGFKPIILEKAGALGGTLNIANQPPHKSLLTELVETMCGELAALNVDIRLNTEATVDNVRELNPYAVFLACGGTPIIPAVPGADLSHVVTGEDVLSGKVQITGKKVLVIGGGVTGLETAEYMAAGNNQITVAEMLDDVGTTLYATYRLTLLARLKSLEVEILTGHKLTEIGSEAAKLQVGSEEKLIEHPCDCVVLALGVCPRKTLRQEFEDAFEAVSVIGDVNKPGMIVDAMTQGNDKAWVL